MEQNTASFVNENEITRKEDTVVKSKMATFHERKCTQETFKYCKILELNGK